MYDLQFNVRVVNRDGKDYVNCWFQQSTLVKKASPIDNGTEIQFSDDDDGDSDDDGGSDDPFDGDCE